MEKDIGQIEVEFNEHALRVMDFLFCNFESATQSLDRSKDDNVFQHLRSKYSYTLKMQLEDLAKSLMDKYRAMPNINNLAKKLTDAIEMYMHEFRQRAESL